MGQSFRGNHLSLHRTLDGRHVNPRPHPSTICHLSFVVCHAKTGYWLVGARRALLTCSTPALVSGLREAPVAQLDRVYDFGSYPGSYGDRENFNF